MKKPVDGFPGYEVHKDGRVYSIKHKKFLKPMRNMKGYLRVGLWKDCKRVLVFVHRLVAKHFHGCILGKEVHHINRRIYDNRAINLRIVTIDEHFEIHHHRPLEHCPF